MNKHISAWVDEVKSVSPDGLHKAHYCDGFEVAMGAPTRGNMKIDNRVICDSAGPSMVWSDDSKYLAFPSWTDKRDQVLCVYDIESSKVVRFSEKWRVIELHTFTDGVITGIDSPIHKSKSISVSYDDIPAEQVDEPNP